MEQTRQTGTSSHVSAPGYLPALRQRSRRRARLQRRMERSQRAVGASRRHGWPRRPVHELVSPGRLPSGAFSPPAKRCGPPCHADPFCFFPLVWRQMSSRERWLTCACPLALSLSRSRLAAQEQAILLKYGQQQQQHQQQRQRAAQLAALASIGTPVASQSSPWSHGLNHQNLTEKLQRAAAAATAHGKDASSSWPHQGSNLTAFGSPAAPSTHHGMWPAAPASPALVPHLAPGLVAQGVPLGMPHMGHMDPLSLSQMAAQQSEDEDLDPKKFKR